MFVIINKDKEFYHHTADGGVEFTTDFVKADLFERADVAMAEWDKNGTTDIEVFVESV